MNEHIHNHSCDECEESVSGQMNKIIISILLLIFAGICRFYSFSPILYIAAYLFAGFDILKEAFVNISKGKVFDENFLMGIATIGALCIREYPEAVMVMLLYRIGEYFQHRAVEKSKKSIMSLMNLHPDYANVEINGEIIKKTPEEVNIDDIIIVKTGEKIPLDGVVTEGAALVDTSALTGEPTPKTLNSGDMALSGCINTNGVLKIKVTKLFKNSTASKILELVQNSEQKKSKSEKFITRFAKYYTPFVVAAAILLVTIPVIFFGKSFSVCFSRALTFLVISCPCALVISVPLSFFAGIGAASACGILIKGSNYLERLANPAAFLFDKTGTLTKGIFKVSKIVPAELFSKEDLMYYTAAVEFYSNHPAANAIKTAYDNEIEQSDIGGVEEFAGKGVKAIVKGKVVLAGNYKLFSDYGIGIIPADITGTVVYVSVDNKFAGSIIISDELKEDTPEAVKQLKSFTKEIAMLTGDSKSIAESIAKDSGMKFYAELLPEDKVKIVEEFISKNKNKGSVIYTGDGINDAPVLALADAGIAMGALGSDAAIESADIVIMDDKLSKIPTGVKIAKKTMNIVRQNIIFALLIKLLFLILGAYGLMTMWGAVFADVGVTLCAVLNSMRSLQTKDFIKK